MAARAPNQERDVGLSKHFLPPIFEALIIPTTASSFHFTVETSP